MTEDGPTPTPTVASPPRLGALDVEAFLSDPSRKQAFVTPMFDIIAPRYDAFTRLFSFGMDRSWKDAALRAMESGAPGAETALDLASGTGDIAIAIARAFPNAIVTSVDASPNMVREAEARLADAARALDVSTRVTTLVGDMCALPLPSESMDLVSAGYGVRNVADAAAAVREMSRVLKPGGLLITLDFYRPAFTPWRLLLLAYLTVAGNAVGWWWHRDPVVYGYIARSIEHFMSWQAFSRLLEREGFRVERVTRHLGGGIAVHEARRVG